MDLSAYFPNEGKQRAITTSFGVFDRYPVRTHVIRRGEDLSEVLRRYVPDETAAEDYLFISEKIVAISQGRAWDISEIRPSLSAKVLCRFVYRSPYGIGLGSPWTMQLTLEEVRLPRLLLAATCSALTKPFGIRGVFYRVAGTAAKAIDGPCDCTIPPYNHYAKKAPKDPTVSRVNWRCSLAVRWSSSTRTISASRCSAKAATRSPRSFAKRSSATTHSDSRARARRCVL